MDAHGPWHDHPPFAADKRIARLQVLALATAWDAWESLTDPDDEFKPLLVVERLDGTSGVMSLRAALPLNPNAPPRVGYLVVAEAAMSSDFQEVRRLIIAGGSRNEGAYWCRPILRSEAGRPGLGPWVTGCVGPIFIRGLSSTPKLHAWATSPYWTRLFESLRLACVDDGSS